MTKNKTPSRNSNYLTIWFLILLTSWVESTVASNINEKVNVLVDTNSSRLIATFKQFHQNPELGFQEFETAATIAAHTKQLGYTVTTGVGGTGVVSVLKNGPGPVVLFRSDMDALPVEERVAIDYASTKKTKNIAGITVPVMHACGHDAHSAWVMGIASVMMELKDHWSGTLVLVAQPAEELLSGAQAMLDAGLLDIIPEPSYIIAGHQMPFWPTGSVALAGGMRTAGSIQMDVIISGEGGHGSMPHVAIDPIVMGTQIVLAYQTIVSRMTDQSKPAVLTVGSFQSGAVNNVIPDSARLKLNLRWYDSKVRDAMVNGIKAVTDNIANIYDVPDDRMPTYTIHSEVPPVFNNRDLTLRAEAAMKDILGAERVLRAAEPHMGSEDFHLLVGRDSSAKVLMIEVGSGPNDVLSRIKQGNPPVFPHNPNFYMEPNSVLYGTRALSAVLLDILAKIPPDQASVSN